MAFTKRDEEILLKIATAFFRENDVILQDWLKDNEILPGEIRNLSKTIGVSLRGYALLPSPIKKRIIDVGTMHIIGRPYTEEQMMATFISISEVSKLYSNCTIGNCHCDSKNDEWKRKCVCTCHLDHAKELLGKDKELNGSIFTKLSGSKDRD